MKDIIELTQEERDYYGMDDMYDGYFIYNPNEPGVLSF